MRYVLIIVTCIGIGIPMFLQTLDGSITLLEFWIWFLLCCYFVFAIFNYIFGKEMLIPYAIFENIEKYKIHRAISFVLSLFMVFIIIFNVLSA